VRTAGGAAQLFERARLELHEDQADTPYLVRPGMLGQERLAELGAVAAAAAPCDQAAPCLLFPETGHTLRAGFLSYWERNGGLATFGYPLTEEFAGVAADGRRRTLQYFERAAFVYDAEHERISLEPIGLLALQVSQVRAPWVAAQVR
jgi:hypothetical protein